MNIAVTVVSVIDALIYATFVVLYVRRRWWTSHTGRIIMALAGPLAVLFAMRALEQVGIVVSDVAWLVGYGLLGAAGIGLIWLLLHGNNGSPGERAKRRSQSSMEE